jgi:hypothetical protein
MKAVLACSNGRYLPPKYAALLSDRQQLQQDANRLNPFGPEERESRDL